MFSRLSFRSVRSLSAALAVAALVLTLAVPVQAAPRVESGTIGPLAAFVADWLSFILPAEDPAPRPTTSLPSPDRDYEPSGVCLDPNGQPITCPESD